MSMRYLTVTSTGHASPHVTYHRRYVNCATFSSMWIEPADVFSLMGESAPFCRTLEIAFVEKIASEVSPSNILGKRY